MPILKGSITFKVVERTGYPNGYPFVFSRSAPWAETSTAIEAIGPILHRKTTHNFIVFMCMAVKTTHTFLVFTCIEVKTTDFAGTSL